MHYLYSTATNKNRISEIERALTPPPSWRDPVTGLPAGFGDEADEWAEWEAQTRS